MSEKKILEGKDFHINFEKDYDEEGNSRAGITIAVDTPTAIPVILTKYDFIEMTNHSIYPGDNFSIITSLHNKSISIHNLNPETHSYALFQHHEQKNWLHLRYIQLQDAPKFCPYCNKAKSIRLVAEREAFCKPRFEQTYICEKCDNFFKVFISKKED